MGSNNIIVREYLESLREDTELDYLFPILLNLMGFRIISTARETKGQSQYGKDIIAIGKDSDGIRHRFYFELKGYDAKDITDLNYFVRDGVRESIMEAKDTAFNDSSIPNFNHLPVMIVLVHNGTIKGNIRPTFEGFITKEFPNGKGFERWDIYHLTDLFSKHLFSEYLLTDHESIMSFKRTLVLLDAPDYDFKDFKTLVDTQLSNAKNVKGRALKKLFATLNLLSVVILHHSKENNNIYPARECLSYLVLKVWAWILEFRFDKKKPILIEFRKLLKIHYSALDEYFRKTLPIALLDNGLYSESGGPFEEVGYPLRCMDYLNYLIYYFYARLQWPSFTGTPSIVKARLIHKHQKSILFNLINNNEASTRPLLDNHSISILNVCLFVLKSRFVTDEDIQFILKYLRSILNNIMVIKTIKSRFPEMYNNIEALNEFCAIGTRPHEYKDSSSLLITTIFEIISILNDEKTYEHFKDIKNKINLQVAYPTTGIDIEQFLFEGTLKDKKYVEHSIVLPDQISELKKIVKQRKHESLEFRTDAAGFSFLRTLACIYFKNEHFAEEWRTL